MLQKELTIKDADYIKWIKLLPCIGCAAKYPSVAGRLQGGSNPHHQNKKGHGKMAGKTDDSRTIPFCTVCHNELHQTGSISFARLYGIDYELVISELNRIYNEYLEAKHEDTIHRC